MNIVSMILQYLAPSIVSKLASSLGINQALAQTMITAALPAILAALTGKSAQPSGAGALFDAIGKQDPGLLGKLAGMIGSPQQKTIADQGTNVLGSLLGAGAHGSLAGAVSKFSGANATATSGLLGMLAPVVLGTLGQQQKSSGLDAGGIAKLLAGQKNNIYAAIPADFAKLLGGTGLLDAVLPKAAVSNATPTSTTSSARPSVPAADFNWWPWAIAIGLAAALWWYVFQGRTPTALAPEPPRIMAGTTDLGGQLDTSLKGLQGLLTSIKDAPSAQAALPKLRETQATIDRLGGMTSQLSIDGRRSLAGYVASWLPLLTPVMTQLLGNSAAGPLVKPVLDGLRTRLETMAKG